MKTAKNESINRLPMFGTPLRYPGGKGRLGPWLAKLMRHNRISGGWYAEPYAGGAGAAIYLLSMGYVNHIVINDLDPAIYSFWWAMLNESEGVIRKVETTPVTIEEWHKQKFVLSNLEAHDPVEVAYATFFLNRTNRSGILSAGVIGGKEQNGNYKLDARFNRDDLVRRIKSIANLKNNISLYNKDAAVFIGDLSDMLPTKSLVYLDPPYYVKGSQLYRNHYAPGDHAAISSITQSLKTPWIVTYDNCGPILDLYKECQSVEFSLHYSTAMARPLATEVMFYGNLDLPSDPIMSRRINLPS